MSKQTRAASLLATFLTLSACAGAQVRDEQQALSMARSCC